MKSKKFLTDEVLIAGLSNLANTNSSLIDNIIEFCEKNSIEPEDIVSIIKSNKALLAKLKKEAENLRLIKKSENSSSDNVLEDFLE